jgi:hypothetical protein
VHQVQVPWAREGSGFTLMMEALMMLLSAEMPVDAMADLLDERDTRLWRVEQRRNLSRQYTKLGRVMSLRETLQQS